MIDVPRLSAQVPRTHGALVANFGRLALTVIGWRIEGDFPDCAKFVMIVAPHTSNWDVPVGLLAKFALRLECRFIAKHSAFWWPLGMLLRALGGIPLNRAAASDFVDDTVRIFREREKLVLIITPEGTRARVERWKSGFHRIASASGVPVVLVVFDYGRKVVRLGPAFPATSDYDGDITKIQSHITAQMAKHPARYGQG